VYDLLDDGFVEPFEHGIRPVNGSFWLVYRLEVSLPGTVADVEFLIHQIHAQDVELGVLAFFVVE
jgi:hypothetical protein